MYFTQEKKDRQGIFGRYQNTLPIKKIKQTTRKCLAYLTKLSMSLSRQAFFINCSHGGMRPFVSLQTLFIIIIAPPITVIRNMCNL